MSNEEILQTEIYLNQRKMLIEKASKMERHNGVQYSMINETVVLSAMEAARKDEAEKSADGHLLKIMKEEPVKVIMWVLAKLGMEMEEAHVGEMDLSQEVTVNSVRYRIAAKVTKTEI